jgi:hypothetical protein
LYLALNKVTVSVTGKQTAENKWNLGVFIKDKYNFDNLQNYKEKGDSAVQSFGKVLNDFAYIAEKLSVIKVFYIYISFEVKDYENA